MKNPNRRNSRGSKAGFTLMEIMLTVAILAVAMTVIYGVLDATLQASRHVEQALNDTEVGPSILNMIRLDLEGALMPYPDKVYFEGKNVEMGSKNEDRLDWVTANAALGKEDEKQEEERFVSVNEVGYQLKPNKDDNNYNILYRREDLFVDDEPLKGGRLIELYDRAKSLNITYYNGKEWVKEWSNVKNDRKLPEAVKVELVLSISSDTNEPVDKTFETTVIFIH